MTDRTPRSVGDILPVGLVGGAGPGAGEVGVRAGVVERLGRVQVLEVGGHEGREQRRVGPA